jgi:hypothetical protein
LGDRPVAQDVMSASYDDPESPLYVQLLERAGKASGEPGKFNRAGGVAIAYDKLIACDTRNQRIQVFDARADDEFFWAKLLRIIEAQTPQGTQRFVEPADIDVAPDGHMFLLDSARQEVVELSPTFDRLGVVGSGYGQAYAVDVSPDGNHIFVTDRGDDKVHHYVRGS